MEEVWWLPHSYYSPPHSFSHLNGLVKVLLEESSDDGGEYSGYTMITHISERDQVEMSKESVSDRVPASSWGTHATHKLSIYN